MTGANASVSNVGLAGGSVIGGQENVGSLVAYLNSGVVQTSFSSAAVTGSGGNTGGLIGFINVGTVQSSYATGAVTGSLSTGGLVGEAVVSSTISNSYATGAVSGTSYIGGLIGASYGSVDASYATGATSGASYTGGLIGFNNGTVAAGYATGAVTGNNDTGGLIGDHAGGAVNASYASGAVTGVTNTGGLIGISSANVQASYATGTVAGTGARTGGLIGQNTGSVQTSYATGAVFGSTAAGGLVAANGATGSVSSSYATGAVTGTGANVGGLIGANNGGAVSSSYSTGAVTGTGTSVGGLVGLNTGTVTASYWDVQTSGRTSSAGGSGAAGLPTAQLQGALPTGFSNTVWSTGAGLYPYLTWQFAAGTTPQSLSGIAYQANGTALAGATLAGTVNGAVFAGATGADGYYYFLLPQGSTAQGSGVFIDIAGNAVKANDYVQGAMGSVQNLNLTAGTLDVVTADTALSSVASGLASAAGGMSATDLVFSTPGGVLTPNAGTGVSIAASGAFSVDQSLVVPNALLLTAAGSLTIASTGSLTSSSGNATLATGSVFVNDAGAAAVSAPNGRWLIYSGDPLNDTDGGLVYDFKQYGATYGVTAAAQATGNGVLYTVTPTIGLTGTVSKTYDGTTTVAPGSFSVGFTGYDQDVISLTYSNLVYGDANAGSGKTVTANGVTVTSASNGSATVYGYALATTASGNIGNIAARPLTVTANAASQVYGNTVPTLTYTIGAGLVSGDSLSGSLATSATSASGVGNYGITQGSLANSNYALTYAAANLTITARPITVTANAQSQVYGNATPALSYTIGGSGLVNNDSLSGSLATSATSASSIGSYAITQGSLAASSNYALTYAAANLTITARPITVTANAQSQVYGNATPALSYTIGGSGLVNNDSLSGSLATSATSASSVGSYGIAQGNLAASSNYALTYAAANLTITARPITVTANAQSQVYGNATPALSYTIGGSGLVNNDSLSGSLATSATSASSIGSYAITQGSLAASSNYALTYAAANLTITARPITVTANAQSQVYGNATQALSYTIGGSGLVNNDSLSGSLATSATSASSVGSYGITQGNLAASSNYALTYAAANLTITARPITVTANAQSQVYGNATPALSYTIGGSGLVNNDSLSGSLATSATSASGVGSYGITQGNLAASSNYALTYAAANLTITARPITVTANAQSQVYGNATPALSYTIGGSGLVNNDSLSGSLATSATSASSVGSYVITQGNLANSNYALTYAAANLTITARPITVTADAQSQVYGNATSALSYTIGGSGLVNNDSLSGSLATSATSASSVGSYAITQGSLAASSNYALTYAAANLTITARPITVTANAQSQVYGNATPALSYTIGGSGLVNNDSLSGSLATSATSASSVGSYVITQGNLANSNYALTYAAANLTITARPITVTADAQSQVYGNATSALSYTIGGSGLVNNDSLSGSLATSATSASSVGSYAITQGSLAASSNYALTYAAANLTITARPIKVTADAQSQVYGNATPALSYTIGGSGLVNNDSLSGSLATSATSASGVGSYAITQGSLAATANYVLGYTAANVTITPRPLAVTADAQSQVYGNATPALTYTVGPLGLVNGDTLAGSLSTNATPASGAGTYAITQGTLINALNPNYAIAYVGATLVVSAALSASSPAAAATPSASPFMVTTAVPSTPKQASINFQTDQSAAAVIAPLAVTPVQAAAKSDQATQTAARRNTDDDIVTGSITPQAFKSADGFVYTPLSQYDPAQYSGKTLPGFESQAGEAAIFTMLLRGALGLPDMPKIDNLFEPGKGFQWRGAKWVNPLADKIRISDGADHIGAPGESFPMQPGTTDLAALLGKGPLILTGLPKAANATSFPLLAVAMSEEGIVANDPGTGLQVLLDYNSETKTLGSIVSVFDSRTKTWTRLADVKPDNDWQSQAQLDQLTTWSGDRFAAVSVPHPVP